MESVTSEADQQINCLTRADKQAYIDGLAIEAEDAVKCNQQGTIYKRTKLIFGKYQTHTNTLIKDKRGSHLMTEKKQEEHWMEHFREILNRQPSEEDAGVPKAADDLDINTAVLEKEEIIKAIKSLKNAKALEHDNLNAELFKADPKLTETTLQPLSAAIWEGGEVPADWTTGVIIRIPKKGTLSNCNIWRGITLLHCCLYQARSLPRSLSSGSQMLLMLA